MRVADLGMPVLGVVGFLALLIAARMDDTKAPPFDIIAYGFSSLAP